MLYGCGGGDLDDLLMINLHEAALAGANDKVKMTGQVKFSVEYQIDPKMKGTHRFVLQNKDGDEPFDTMETLDASLPLYKPENLADFIRWSKRQCPAKNYILILWNHGNGWYPIDDNPKNRGILADDNVGKLMMLYCTPKVGHKTFGVQYKRGGAVHFGIITRRLAPPELTH